MTLLKNRSSQRTTYSFSHQQIYHVVLYLYPYILPSPHIYTPSLQGLTIYLYTGFHSFTYQSFSCLLSSPLFLGHPFYLAHEYAKYLPTQNKNTLRLTPHLLPPLVLFLGSSVQKNFTGTVYTSSLHFLTLVLSLNSSCNFTKTALKNVTSGAPSC